MESTHRTFVAAINAIAAFAFTGEAPAQVIQLPTFRTFTMSTTVSVPDRGSVSLGGVSSSSRYRSERGLPGLGHMPFAGRVLGNRTIAGHTHSGRLSVSAQVHDFEAMEEELSPTGVGSYNAAASALPAGVGSRKSAVPDEAGRFSVAELRRQQAARQQAEQARARRDFERGRELLAAGRADLAKVYFQQAATRGNAELRSDIAAALGSRLPARVR
jgi:hypothetical protein